MAGAHPGNHPFQQEQPFLEGQFDVLDWHPYFQSCVQYFLEHAQYNGPVQALAAFINIQLPFQRAQNQKQYLLSPRAPSPAVAAAAAAGLAPPHLGQQQQQQQPQPPPPPPLSPAQHPYPPYHHAPTPTPATTTTLLPYIRRLVATGFDFPAVLHGFFGDDWELGVRPLHEQERRNYLFAVKSGSWLDVKRAYDDVGAGGTSSDEAAPFLKPLRNVTELEIVQAEEAWSEWLAMQDWMLGPRSLETPARRGGSSSAAGGMRPPGGGGVRIKREEV